MTITQRINTGLKRVPAWPLYIVGPLPVIWLYYLGLTNQLGADPVKVIEQQLGLIGLQLIVAGLMITPLRRFAGLNLIKFRRAIGLLAFFYVTVHLLTWLVFDTQLDWAYIWMDIVKRPYITIGMTGFLLLLPLAVTSNNISIRRLGPATWNKLHRLTYAAALAGAVHYVWLVKGWQTEPLVYLAGIVVLLMVRIRIRSKRIVASTLKRAG
ncbi:protein-methionine-sulfoxide reductase heme-binding subunit MsrQ [Profundibacter sp.]